MDKELAIDLDLEPRLIKRYTKLVRSHIGINQALSAGVKSFLSTNQSFSQTQAAWRFLNNDRCTLPKLAKPILEKALSLSNELCTDYALIAHDWSGLSYKGHSNKKDRYGIHNPQELGYELQASILLSDINGAPIAPVVMNLVTKDKIHSTYGTSDLKATHLEELTKRIKYLESLGIKRPLVHIIDREGDGVEFLRQQENTLWVIRAKKNSCVTYDGVNKRIDKVAREIDLLTSREIDFKGKKAIQQIGKAEVQLTRISKPKKKLPNGKRIKPIAGKAILARLIVSRVIDKQGNELGWWYLLSNVQDCAASTIVVWYYWRWSIESFFKLLKSSGMQLESWQQETGGAIARRLLVACMACVFIWELSHADGEYADELRTILVRLSGKQMRYGKKFTFPALLAGLWTLLSMIDLLSNTNIERLKFLLAEALPNDLCRY